MGGYELLLIALIGIIVLGPEKMPKAIRSVYRFIRGVRQFADNVTSELDEELRIKELHNNLKQAEQQGFKNLSPEVQASVEELQKAAESVREGYKMPDTIAMPHMQESINQHSQETPSSRVTPPLVGQPATDNLSDPDRVTSKAEQAQPTPDSTSTPQDTSK